MAPRVHQALMLLAAALLATVLAANGAAATDESEVFLAADELDAGEAATVFGASASYIGRECESHERRYPHYSAEAMSTMATVLSRRRWHDEHAGPITCPPNTGLVPTLVCRHYKWVPGYKCADVCAARQVNCTAQLSDQQCQVAGTCNPATGQCSTPTDVADTTSCDGGGGLYECQNGACVPSGCFSADTRVLVQGQAQPVRMADLQVGQQVACVTLPGLAVGAAPTTAQWCELKSFVHADSSLLPHTRISYAQPGGGEGALTISHNHLMHLLVGATEGQTAASVAGLGTSFQTIRAGDVKAGDLIAIATTPASLATTFTAVRVTANDGSVQAEGFYVPDIEYPYLIGDGVVVPVYTNVRSGTYGPSGRAGEPPGIANLLLHTINAPIWMDYAADQPVGTAAKDARWQPGNQTVWPVINEIGEIAKQQVSQGKQLDVGAWLGFFHTRYAAWKQGGAPITTQELLDAMAASWVN